MPLLAFMSLFRLGPLLPLSFTRRPKGGFHADR